MWGIKMNNKTQIGVGLVEVLVSLLVVSTAILGLAGLQTIALKKNAEALVFTQATQLSSDMFERIRTNVSYAVSTEDYYLDFDDEVESPSHDCSSASCEAEEVAQYDLYHWQQNLFNSIADGEAEIVVAPLASGTSNALITINIRYLHTETSSLTPTGADSDYEQLSFIARI
jgi:type IV pilus assembly protein PilV